MSRRVDPNEKNKKEQKKRPAGKIDPFIGSRTVEGLNPRSYDDYLSAKDITMVMFYDPSSPQCEWSKKHFLKAAKTTHRMNHGYAAVDCIHEAELCAQEGVTSLPTFKLFVGNKLLDTYTNPQQMTFQTIRDFVMKMKIIPDAPPCVRPCDKEKNVCSSKRG